MLRLASQSLELRAAVRTDVDHGSLLELILDVDRYVSVEPRLDAVHWVTPGPAVGAVADIAASIPYQVRLLERVFGQPRVRVTVSEWAPPDRIRTAVSGPAFTGTVDLRIFAVDFGCVVLVRGGLRLRRPAARVLLAPLQPALERRATRSIQRAIARAVIACGGTQARLIDYPSPSLAA